MGVQRRGKCVQCEFRLFLGPDILLFARDWNVRLLLMFTFLLLYLLSLLLLVMMLLLAVFTRRPTKIRRRPRPLVIKLPLTAANICEPLEDIHTYEYVLIYVLRTYTSRFLFVFCSSCFNLALLSLLSYLLQTWAQSAKRIPNMWLYFILFYFCDLRRLRSEYDTTSEAAKY